MSVISRKHLQVTNNNSCFVKLPCVMSMLLRLSTEFTTNFCGWLEFLCTYLVHSFRTFVVMKSGQGQRENWISYQSLGSYWPSCPQKISTLNLWDLLCLKRGIIVTKSSLFLDLSQIRSYLFFSVDFGKSHATMQLLNTCTSSFIVLKIQISLVSSLFLQSHGSFSLSSDISVTRCIFWNL